MMVQKALIPVILIVRIFQHLQGHVLQIVVAVVVRSLLVFLIQKTMLAVILMQISVGKPQKIHLLGLFTVLNQEIIVLKYKIPLTLKIIQYYLRDQNMILLIIIESKLKILLITKNKVLSIALIPLHLNLVVQQSRSLNQNQHEKSLVKRKQTVVVQGLAILKALMLIY